MKMEKENVPKFYVLNILKSLCCYYKKEERWFHIENGFQMSEDNFVLNKHSSEIKFLSYELGVSEEFLIDKLKEMINSNYQLIDF